jgi:hypothetical protein
MAESIRNLEKGVYVNDGCVVYKPSRNVAITIREEDLVPVILGRNEKVCGSEYFNRSEFLEGLTELSKDSSFRSGFPDAYKLAVGDIELKLSGGSVALFAGCSRISDEQGFGDLCKCAVSGELVSGLNVSYRSVVESWVNSSQKGLSDVRRVKLRNSCPELYRELYRELFPEKSGRGSLNKSPVVKYLAVGGLVGSLLFSAGYLGLSNLSRDAEIQDARRSVVEDFVLDGYLRKAEELDRSGSVEDRKRFSDVVSGSDKLKLVPEDNSDLKRLEEIVNNWK